MGRLLAFSRTAQDEVPVPMTPEDRRRDAELFTKNTCKRLITYYQSLETWTPAYEAQLVPVVRALTTLCQQLTPVAAPVVVQDSNHDEKV